MEAQEQQEAVQRAKANEDRRRDRALLSRYPSQRKHDEERTRQLALVESVLAYIHIRSQELIRQRTDLDIEMEFYKAAPSEAPAWLLRRLEDNTQQMERQERLVADKELEKQRINSRFDEELAHLRRLWAPEGKTK